MVLCASLFSQLVALFSKSQFYHLVKEHRAERYCKGFGSWDHLWPCYSVNWLRPRAYERFVGV